VRPALVHRLDVWARHLAPVASTWLMLIIGVVPLPIPHFLPLDPGLAIISVYYWAIHRPGLLPAAAVFLIGLFGDLLGMAPLGVGTLMLLLVFGIASSQRRVFFGQPFLVVWGGFMMVAAGAMALGWILSSVLAGAALALYPAVADLFARAQRGFLRSI
jgi:rod shape-determining protein MreD